MFNIQQKVYREIASKALDKSVGFFGGCLNNNNF